MEDDEPIANYKRYEFHFSYFLIIYFCQSFIPNSLAFICRQKTPVKKKATPVKTKKTSVKKNAAKKGEREDN